MPPAAEQQRRLPRCRQVCCCPSWQQLRRKADRCLIQLSSCIEGVELSRLIAEVIASSPLAAHRQRVISRSNKSLKVLPPFYPR